MIELQKTLDVAAVEKKLAELWAQTTAEGDEKAVLRSRVANLIVFVSGERALQEVAESMQSLTAAHPGRALLLLGDRSSEDHDIEMFVTSICHTDKRTGARHLCGEEVTLKASGKFVVELPSAAVPLLVSDLSTFLYWRDTLDVSDEVLRKLLVGTDRLVIDSAEFKEPQVELTQTNSLLQEQADSDIGVSDLNWERLTLWRALLADFYDVPAYQQLLDQIETVRIDYVEPESEKESVAPQALLIAGWLASRLGWTIHPRTNESFNFTAPSGRAVSVEFNRRAAGTRKPGRLVSVELSNVHKSPASFVVERSEDNNLILAEARVGSEVKRGRVLPVRNRSTAQLLAREMEILWRDRVYQEAVVMAARMIEA